MCFTIKKRVSLFFFLSIFTTSFFTATSQSYWITPGDSIVGLAPFDDISVFNFQPVNQGNDTLYFLWKKKVVNLPSTWEVRICDSGHCYIGLADSSYMSAAPPGDAGLLSLHIHPHFESGTGIVQVWMSEANTPVMWDTLTWIITANGPASFTHFSNNKIIQVYPNPVGDILQVENIPSSSTRFALMDIMGRIRKKGILQASLNVSNLEGGLYVFANSGFI